MLVTKTSAVCSHMLIGTKRLVSKEKHRIIILWVGYRGEKGGDKMSSRYRADLERKNNFLCFITQEVNVYNS